MSSPFTEELEREAEHWKRRALHAEGRNVRRLLSDYRFLGALDLALGLNYLVLPIRNYSHSVGLHGPTRLLPVHVWGLLFVATALGEFFLRRTVRQVWTVFLGVSSQTVFAGGLISAFVNGETGHGIATTFGGAALLLGWAARHFVVAVRDRAG